ncbi:filamentous hemagglutinin N-terminal domain-containing protein [Herbaspirillum sp. LeCh32-8]|uniref:beta strand repeat-containing protein n=1 Tax=Herbaspirillum sp. LeCh32-8 TaxID=2821356 RepID=UPI001AE90453|nr:filamentous hemagglutinin N-terminal domain-containing protein [Herbaspirillum sp. LeCh32-8]MBP0598549.1 filamentous hemagglutinin N-terminal domain-containing protein [Herbaspirillum sp. LeCh32-8]
MTTTSTSAKSAQPKIELLPPSITLRVGRRRLTLSWRARKPLPSLLSSLLQRSWRRVLAPVLKVSVATAAVCGAWQTAALAAAPAPGTLPSGWSVVNGNVTFTQNGNTLNISQLTPQAIAEFASFSIGSGAVVDISQPGAAAAFLAKVTGGDISQIYGKLTAPGTVVLFNPNGVMVGAGGVVDVGRFVATTLNISNDDFLAGKLTFAKDRATVGAVENYGTITSATGGSVYLIGSSVTNGGVIRSPQGEVILAAGQTVTLADTATPGVTVNVTGSTGDVTNLGTITAEAGRIGIAAGLITNSGNISASSVVREGGRIFLRASTNLTTTATSLISADGTTGGSIVLNGGDKAYIDGDVSAIGTAGAGGFVDTSGHVLDVVKAPKVGAGGTWLIDPFDLEVYDNGSISSGTNQDNTDPLKSVVTSTANGAKIANGTINGLLDNNINVTLQTAAGDTSQAGNITVNADITKQTAGAAKLTLNADQDILIKANITSTSGTLGLDLHTQYANNNVLSPGVVTVDNARVELNGGIMSVSDGAGSKGVNNGTLVLSNAAVSLGTFGTLNTGNLTVGENSNFNANESSSIHANNITVQTSGKLNMSNASSLSANTLTVEGADYQNERDAGNISADGAALFNVANTVNNNGEITLTNVSNATVGSFWNGNGDGGVGNLTLINTNFTVNTVFENKYSTVNTGGITRIVLNGDLNNRGDLNFGGADSSDGSTSISGSGTLYNYRNIVVAGFMGEGPADSEYAHTLTMTNTGGLQQSGEMTNLYVSNTLATANINDISSGVGSSVRVSGGGNLLVSNSTSIDGYLDIQGGNATLRGTTSLGGSTSVYDGNLTAANTTLSGGMDVFGGNVTLTGTTAITGTGIVTVNGGNLSAANTQILGQLNAQDGNVTLSGTTTGTGTLNVSGYSYYGEQAFVVTDAPPSLIYSTNVVLGDARSNLNVNVTGGQLVLNGSARVDTMNVTGGVVNGLAGSRLNVAESFAQSGGNITLADAALSQNSGNLVIGNITATNLVLEATNGDIVQYNSSSCGTVFTSLHVTKQLIASASGNINLSNPNTNNQIAAFAANSSGMGNISLLNNLNTTDTSAVTINGVNAANGNVSIENYGAMRTAAIGSNADFLGGLPSSLTDPQPTTAQKLATLGINSTGQVNAANGTVSLTTHSPLTIGSGGVSASGGISLVAGVVGDLTSNLVINGIVTTSSGNINLSGNAMNINANITAPGGSVTLPTGITPTYAPGVAITTSSGTVIPVAYVAPVTVSTNTAATVAAQQTAQQQQNQQTQSLQNTVSSAAVSSETSSTTSVQQASNGTQTTGGTSGTFGDEGDGKKASGKKQLPMCT